MVGNQEVIRDMKILIAYFSREGNNYVNGSIVHLSLGNTQVTAEKIKKLTDGELFRIDPQKAYSSDYTSSLYVDDNPVRFRAVNEGASPFIFKTCFQKPQVLQYLCNINK